MSSFLSNVHKVIILATLIGICLIILHFGMNEILNTQEKYFLRSLVSFIITLLLGCVILKISLTKREKMKRGSNIFFMFQIFFVFLLTIIILFFLFSILSKEIPILSFLAQESFLMYLFPFIFIVELFQYKKKNFEYNECKKINKNNYSY